MISAALLLYLGLGLALSRAVYYIEIYYIERHERRDLKHCFAHPRGSGGK